MVTQELINNIVQRFQQGQNRQQIIDELVAKGWEEKDIARAIVDIRHAALKQLPIISHLTQKMIELEERTAHLSHHYLLGILGIAALLLVGVIFLLNSLGPMDKKSSMRDNEREKIIVMVKPVLEKYYRDNNVYPTTLQQLVPQYMSVIPLDPKTNEPYPYGILEDNRNYEFCVVFEQQPKQCISSRPYSVEEMLSPTDALFLLLLQQQLRVLPLLSHRKQVSDNLSVQLGID